MAGLRRPSYIENMALYSIQVERHVLGGLIQNSQIFSDIEGFVSEKAFFIKPHDVIFSCIRSSFLNNEKLDKVLLAQKVQNLGITFKEDVSIFDYIESISFAPITPEATVDACKELVKLKALRDIDETALNIKEYIAKNVNQDLNKTIVEVDALYGEKINAFDFVQEPEEMFFDIYEIVEERGNNPIEDIGLKTPFEEFNKKYGGLRGGNVYAFASRSGEGKSTLLSYLGAEVGRLNEVPVLVLDTEMTTTEMKFRNAAAFTGVPLWYLETGNWRKNKEYTEKIRTYLPKLKNKYKVYHYYVGNKNIDEVVSIIRRWFLSVVGRGKKGLVVYDYLKLTGEKVGANWAEFQALGEKTDKLKRVSIEFDIPVLTAIQVNRIGETQGKASTEIVDDGSVIAQSDRILWFVTGLWIFRRKTADEVVLDTENSGTHKLIEIKTRYQGKEATGHNPYVRRQMPDGTVKFVRNYLNFLVDNFMVEERGSVHDAILRQNAQFRVQDGQVVAQETL
jgi:replicative DNA helicase